MGKGKSWVFYVSPDGSDRARGTRNEPLRTLTEARNRIRLITRRYHTARREYEKIHRECFEKRSALGLKRLQAWQMFARSRNDQDLQQAKAFLAQVNREDKAAKKREAEAYARFKKNCGDNWR
ncbi:MAG: hypothetical protein D6820_02120, partial [Lentisphaerae bacterium]